MIAVGEVRVQRVQVCKGTESFAQKFPTLIEQAREADLLGCFYRKTWCLVDPYQNKDSNALQILWPYIDNTAV